MSTIVISYNGTNITSDVVIEDAVFISMVNGNPGSCAFRVRDPNRDKAFTVGKKITVDVDSRRVWAGYLISVNRLYAFPAEDTDPADDITRFLLLKGFDNNILFRKRAVHKDTDITNVEGPTYAYPTTDVYAISQLVNHWIDLDAEIDATSLISGVGFVNIGEQDWTGYGGGVYWGVAMDEIARTHGAVYYLTPEYKLLYGDVDSANSPYVLTDNPTSSGDIGYREFSITHDGANLINDSLIWGAGGGASTPVVSHKIDSSSIATHGRWQFGGKYQGVWKQSTINHINNSIVDGTPSNKRGAKNDRVSVDLVTTSPVFLPGYKVPIYSTTYAWNDTLPIRRMEIRFASPTDPIFKLTLSHEIDRPFDGLIDPVRYALPKPPGYKPPPLPPIIGKGDPPPPCDDAVCGITDTFTRTVANFDDGYYTHPNAWGTSDSGLQWSGSTIATFADGSSGVLGIYAAYPGYNPPAPSWALPAFASYNIWGQQAYLNWPDDIEPLDVTWEIQLNRSLNGDDTGHSGNPNYWGEYFWIFLGDGPPFGQGKWEIIVSGEHGVWLELYDDWTGVEATSRTSLGIDMTQPFKIRATGAGAGQPYNVYVWQSSGTQPSTPTKTITGTTWSNHGMTIELTTNNNTVLTPLELHVLSVDMRGLNRCSEAYLDNFDRFGSNGWGTATSGQTWVVDPAQAPAFSVVGAGVGGRVDQSDSLGSGDYTISIPLTGLTISPSPIDVLITYSAVVTQEVNRSTGIPVSNPYFVDDVFYISNTSDLSGYWMAAEVYNPDANVPYTWNISPSYPTYPDVGYLEQSTYLAAASVENRLRFQFDSTGIRGRMWKSTETEPTDWLFYSVGTTDITDYFLPTWFVIQPRQSAGTIVHAPGDKIEIQSILISYTGQPCYEGSPGYVNSFYCESISTYPGMTSFKTTSAWTVGTTEVYLNGLALTRGVDYGETDWVTRTITLLIAIQGGDQVRVCYERTNADTANPGAPATIRTGGSNIPL